MISYRILHSIVCAALLSGLMFLSDGDSLKMDVLDPERVNIRSETGEFKGYMKRDLLTEDRINIYKRDRRQKGYLCRKTAWTPRSRNSKKLNTFGSNLFGGTPYWLGFLSRCSS